MIAWYFDDSIGRYAYCPMPNGYWICLEVVIFYFSTKLMRGLLRLAARQGFANKKLGIADTSKVIIDKIMNITDQVPLLSSRPMSTSTAPSSASAMVLPVLSDSTRSRQERWSSSGQASGGWPSTSKQITLESLSSETTGTFPYMQTNPGGRLSHANWSHRRCPHRRGDVG